MTENRTEISRGRRAGPVRSIVIVGGGTAGWMAAAQFVRYFEHQDIDITLIESSEIATVGVGEATVPGIRKYIQGLGLSEFDVMRASGGTMKLGIRFIDWRHEGSEYFHPFSIYGSAKRGIPFHHYWLHMRQEPQTEGLESYSVSALLAKAGRVRLPQAGFDYIHYNWALHFDAAKFAHVLRNFAIGLGVTRIDAKIVDVELAGDDGFIRSLRLHTGQIVHGDLFIDCSGFRSLLLGGALGVRFIDWSHLLPCDRALAVQCELKSGLAPYTRAIAREAGWQWRIPLQHRVGNGYVYASAHVSDAKAFETLNSNLEGATLSEPNLIKFTTGHREQFWFRNCLALGLASGFLEPLESTSITLIQAGIEKLLMQFPDRSFNPVLAEQHNQSSVLEFERIRDFIILHYWGNQRIGETMWDDCRNLQLPDTLAHRIALFRESGALLRHEHETFWEPSWLSIFNGLGVLPARANPAVNYFNPDELRTWLAALRRDVRATAQTGINHEDFIAQYCAQPEFAP
ncbi:MAG: tryptophan halogenase family protein [Terricaulis silvestris]